MIANNSDLRRATSIFDHEYKNCEIITIKRDDAKKGEVPTFTIEFYDNDKDYIATTVIEAIPACEVDL